MQGHSNGDHNDLTELGFIQAKLLAKKLSKIKFDEVITSDLKRAQNTVRIILNENKNTKCFAKDNEILRERKGGLLEGKSLDFVNIIYQV